MTSFFGDLVKTVVNVAKLPVNAAIDVAALLPEAGEKDPFWRTRENIQEIEDDADA